MNIDLGSICAFGSSFTWATGSAIYSRLSRSHSPFAINFTRAVIALPFFIAILFITSGGWNAGIESLRTIHLRNLLWFTLSTVTSYGFGDVLFLWSTRILGVSVALAIASAYPLWTTGIGAFIRGEHLTWSQLIGVFLAVAGMMLVILKGVSGLKPVDQPIESPLKYTRKIYGFALAIAASIAWAVNTWSIAEGGKNLSAPVGNSLRMLLAVIISAGIGKFVFSCGKVLLPRRVLLRFSWALILESVIGSFFYLYGMTHTSLAVGATLTSLAPVLSIPVAWAFGIERFSFSRTSGIILVVIGLALLVTGA